METKVVQSEPAVGVASLPAIAIDGLTKRYGEDVVLDRVSFEVPENSIFGFLGPNGAGKTTTIKILLGLARASSGKTCIFGLDEETESLAIRRRIGYLAQDPLFYPHMTARETLAFTNRFFYSGPEAGMRRRIDETLELVGLEDKADRPIKGFSGGERQRLGIAQAQVSHPDLLILDEPAAALDPVGRRDVLEIMERLKDHTTIFYSTHILDDVQRVSDRVAILDRGRLVASATTDDLLNGDSATYEVTVRGDGKGAVGALAGRPWANDPKATHHNGVTMVTVSVSDETAAENELLRTVMADGTTVVGFGRKKTNLEDVFLGLVERHEN
ncbi:MAG: ABC transporter ATP-binding protein [Acidimicrobiia bacterium]